MFNCKKTVGIQFGNRCNNCVIKLNGNEIKWQRSVKHLGNIIDQKLSESMPSPCKLSADFSVKKLRSSRIWWSRRISEATEYRESAFEKTTSRFQSVGGRKR